jgi:hypothetical protein
MAPLILFRIEQPSFIIPPRCLRIATLNLGAVAA